MRKIKRTFFGFLLATIGNIVPSNLPSMTKLGDKFRYLCAKNIVSEIGPTAHIKRGANIGKGVVLKDGAVIGFNCSISSGTTIEGNNMMGPNCITYTSNHKFDNKKLDWAGMTETQPVLIKAHSWLGSRCIILPGVTIGKYSIIGAGSVVTKDVPDYHLAAGNPARIIKDLRD